MATAMAAGRGTGAGAEIAGEGGCALAIAAGRLIT
jgi:hypothetical protein